VIAVIGRLCAAIFDESGFKIKVLERTRRFSMAEDAFSGSFDSSSGLEESGLWNVRE
jgi:hypothetical protein